MHKGTGAQASVDVEAPPEVVYEVVTDVTRMGAWSPETVKCEWLDGAVRAAVGARFKGTNKRGILRWSTKPTVVVADPAREFSFEVGNDIRWTYRFDAQGNGTRLTESFEMLRDLPSYFAFAERWLLGIKDRRADLEHGMTVTLERIKRVVESDPDQTDRHG